MTTLMEDDPITFADGAGDIDGFFICEGTIYAGQAVVNSTTTPWAVKDPGDDDAAGFAGIAKSGGVAGDRIPVRRKGTAQMLSGAATVALGDQGTAVYIDTSGTANNNPRDCTKTSTNNLPWGEISAVEVAGAAGTGKFEVAFAADGLRGV